MTLPSKYSRTNVWACPDRYSSLVTAAVYSLILPRRVEMMNPSQRHEVARGAHATLLIDNGAHAVVEELDETLYGVELDAAVAVGERLDLEEVIHLYSYRRPGAANV